MDNESQSNSYIKCTGPVITVDGRTFPAPFVIEAIGDMNVLVFRIIFKRWCDRWSYSG